MVDPSKARMQSMLQSAVQSLHWTYSLFWQLCPQQGILIWSDGYYNGAIKTRKTVQPIEVSTEEATLQRSQQLRELYESLSAGEPAQPLRRPSAALSPEDLTESEWFYLLCVSFSFPPGVGLPGKAYVKKQHVWLTRANEVDSKVFSRAILAKSARIQTVVCIPLLEGVVELGTTESVEEDKGLIQRAKSFFLDVHNKPNHPRPALSEHSTSNPPSSSEPHFHSPAILLSTSAAPTRPSFDTSQLLPDQKFNEEEEEDQAIESDSDAEIGDRMNTLSQPQNSSSQLMKLHMSDQDIRLESPDDGSNSDFHLRWLPKDPISTETFNDVLAQEEDTHYSQTVSTILENQSHKWSTSTAMSSPTSAFSAWSSAVTSARHGLSQCALKYVLFTVPSRHAKSHDPTARRGTTTSLQDELSANHVLAERRRREKLNERFIILRSLVPFVTKMDKASILGDTIEYLKQLLKRIQDLEKNASGGATSRREKRKMGAVKDGGGKGKAVGESPAAQVEVSIIETDALVEMECANREGLLLDVMQALRDQFKVEVTTVQSSVADGVFAAELRAKVKESENGRRASITEVKRSIRQIIIGK